MKRGFLKGGFSGQTIILSPAPKAPAVKAGGKPTSTTTKLPKSSTGSSSAESHFQYNPAADVPPGIFIDGFGGSNKSMDTVIVTDGPDSHATIRKHPYYHIPLNDELAAFNAGYISVRPIPRKQLGMVAKRDIALGEVFLRERPIVVVPNGSVQTRFRLWTILETSATAERRAAYYQLHNCRPPGPAAVDAASILRTNALPVLLPFQEEQYSGAFDLMSRANHSCTPNAEYLFDYDTFCGELRAISPIKAATEIRITYIDLLRSAEERKAELLYKYSFVCDCPACDPSSPTFAKSDIRRTIISRLLPRCHPGTTKEAYVKQLGDANYDDKHVEKTLRLLDDEGLSFCRTEVLSNFARFEQDKASFSEDYFRAIILARRGLEEAKKLGVQRKTDEWFELTRMLEFCLEKRCVARKAQHGGRNFDCDA